MTMVTPIDALPMTECNDADWPYLSPCMASAWRVRR